MQSDSRCAPRSVARASAPVGLYGVGVCAAFLRAALAIELNDGNSDWTGPSDEGSEVVETVLATGGQAP